MKSAVKQKDIADIMNRIEEALFETGYVPVGYDNTGTFLQVIIDKKWGFEMAPQRKDGEDGETHRSALQCEGDL